MTPTGPGVVPAGANAVVIDGLNYHLQPMYSDETEGSLQRRELRLGLA